MTGSCPKHMVMGPCGGVRADGRCEVVPEPCVFPAPAQWAEPVPAVPLRAVPLILTDFSSEPYSVRLLKMVARTLAPSCDAVLVGEHQDRPDFPPTLLASMLQDARVRPWMTLACRDRNRIVLEEELSGLRHLKVDAVLCDPQTLRATGYLVRSWYKFNRNVWLENTVEHTSKAFLGLTLWRFSMTERAPSKRRLRKLARRDARDARPRCIGAQVNAPAHPLRQARNVSASRFARSISASWKPGRA